MTSREALQDALDEWARANLPTESAGCITSWSDWIAAFVCDDVFGDSQMHPLSDIRDLDEVVRELGIQDSSTTPAEAVRELNAEIERLRSVAATPLTVCSLCLGTGKVFHENPPRKDTPYSRCHCQVQGPNQPAATPQVPWKGNLSVDLRKGALSVNADGVTLIDEAGVCWAIVFPDKDGFYEHAAVIATLVSRPNQRMAE